MQHIQTFIETNGSNIYFYSFSPDGDVFAYVGFVIYYCETPAGYYFAFAHTQ